MQLKICTYNIRCDVKIDGINAFAGRAPLIAREFPKYGADIIGFQEMLPHVRARMEAHFPAYTFVGTGRDVHHGGEHVAIAYRTSLFRLMALDTFWLSPTPYVPGSRFTEDQSTCPRICTCAVLLMRETGQILRVYNTHLDHEGKRAKADGIAMITKRILADDERYGDSPVVLTGDFNEEPGGSVTETVKSCHPLGGALCAATADVGATFHAYRPAEVRMQIDYIYTNAPCTPAIPLTDTDEGVYFSDHYPVMTEITL